ncbi:MAG: DedA family protein [Silicimonas sp.]|nr:DedA family protein [Silicimonas sp.]
MLRRLYDWTLSLADHPRALWALAVVSFVESSFFPIPPDVLMIPMIIARPSRAWLIALVAMIASVLGGLFGYFIGAVLFDTLGQAIFDFYGKSDAVDSFNQRFNDYGAWAVLVAGVTPFPYKVITIMSGWTGLSLPIFILSSIIARSLRFFILAALLWKFGAPIRGFIEKYLGLLFTVFIVLLFGGFYLVRYM